MQPWEDEEGKSCAIDHGVEGKHPYDADGDDDDDDEKEDGNVDDKMIVRVTDPWKRVFQPPPARGGWSCQ